MTPSLGTWERVNADVADKGRSKLVWERQGDSITDRLLVVAMTFKGQLSSQQYETCH